MNPSPSRDVVQDATQFVDLICADPDLLRAEFDAIIQAEWNNTPPRRPNHRASEGRPPARSRADNPGHGRKPHTQPKGADPRTRERSPPHPTPRTCTRSCDHPREEQS